MTCLKSFHLAIALALCCITSFAQGWSSVAPLPDGFVSNHSYGFALDSMGYLVAGESTDGFTNAFYQYDPTADVWTALEDFPGTARGYTIGDQAEGLAWLGFGLSNSGYLNDLWVFDPDSMAWTEKASCPCTARTHPAFVAEGDKIFVGLGGSPNGDMNDWWEYDIPSDSWSQKPDFPGTVRHHPYQFGIDGLIYVGFGHNGPNIFNDWYVYDPVAETWEERETLPAEGRVAGTQFAHNGMGYALSGDGDDHSSMETGEIWQYDPVADAWNAWPPHPGMSRWAPASFVLNDDIYLINGMSMDPGSFDYMATNWKLATQPATANDGAVSAYLGASTVCSGEETPIVAQITNWGANALAYGDAMALTVEMVVDGDVVLASDWSGSLSTYQSADFTLGMYAFAGPTAFTLQAQLNDDNASNDALESSITVSPSATTQWLMTLETDDWGDETGWEVRDGADNVVAAAEPGSYASLSDYEVTISLPSTGCYTFTLIDTYGDGLNGGTWGGSNGSCSIQSLDDAGSPVSTFFDYDGSFGFDELSEVVDVNQSVDVGQLAGNAAWTAFPNPVGANLNVAGVAAGKAYEVLDSRGRMVTSGRFKAESQQLDASDWPEGILLFIVGEGANSQMLRLIKY